MRDATDGQVHALAANAFWKTTALVASSSRNGVRPRRLPYAPNRSARRVSMTSMMMFGCCGRRSQDVAPATSSTSTSKLAIDARRTRTAVERITSLFLLDTVEGAQTNVGPLLPGVESGAARTATTIGTVGRPPRQPR